MQLYVRLSNTYTYFCNIYQQYTHSSRPMDTTVCMHGHHIQQSMDQPGKVANPARGQLKRKMNVSVSAFAPENLVSRDGFGSPFPRQPAHLHSQAESGAYIRDSSRFLQRRPLLYLKRPDAIESVPSVSDHAIAYRWRSLPRVRRHRASTPLGSSERVLPFLQVTMDQLIYASLSHTHYWHEVGILYLFTMVAPARTLYFYLFCNITRASVSVHLRISAEYLYSSEHALW